MYERLKSKKLAYVLIGYYLRHQITDIQLDIKMTKEKTVISIHGRTPEKIDGIDELCEQTFKTRRVEFEDYYDELLGVRDSDSELEIMGYLVDEAYSSYQDGVLTFTIVRVIKD